MKNNNKLLYEVKLNIYIICITDNLSKKGREKIKLIFQIIILQFYPKRFKGKYVLLTILKSLPKHINRITLHFIVDLFFRWVNYGV